MKKSIKTSLIFIALALVVCLACLVWLVSRPDEPVDASVSDTSRGPSFELRCRPADRATGYLSTTRAGSGELYGRFLVELARCENAETGKILDTEAGARPGEAWPSAPLTLRGSFAGLPQRSSLEPKGDRPTTRLSCALL